MYVVDKKRSDAKSKIYSKCGCGSGCSKCSSKIKFIDRMADANIPVAYWFKRLEDFSGPENIKITATNYIRDLSKNFDEGRSICFTGNLGTGKTYSSCCILKSALISGFDVYYTTLSDLIFYLTDFEFKKEFYSKVSRSDFLCIDEIDSRHFSDSEQSGDFFGRTFERIFRYRLQNNLPIIMATNNASLDEAFAGQFKKIMGSLTNFSTALVPALGTDHRLKKGLKNDK